MQRKNDRGEKISLRKQNIRHKDIAFNKKVTLNNFP